MRTSRTTRTTAPGPQRLWFRIGNASRGLDWWQSNVEPSALEQLVAYPDPDRTTATYASMMGLKPTHAVFIAEARQQSRQDWRPRYTAAAVISYVRSGLGLK